MIYNPLSLCCLLLAALFLRAELNEGAKILGIFPFQAKSHAIMTLTLMEELAARGHEVTVISFHPQKKPLNNYKDIVIKTFVDFRKENDNNTLFQAKDIGMFGLIDKIWASNARTCEQMLQEEEIQKLIHSKDLHFDLVIMEAFFNECFLGFVYKFKAPLVQICTFGGAHWMGDWVGNPNPYSYVPDPFLHFNDKMNFLQRIANTFVGTFIRLGREWYYVPKQDAIMKKYFNDSDDLPSVREIEKTTSLLLVNGHFSINFPKPLMPNIIQVAGLHVKPPKKLPEDLQKFLDEAEDGAIYFSMGSNLKSSELPDSTRDAFLEAFSKLKQRILWKWEDDTLPGHPSNLKISKWFPQADILAHPKVRLFITHGGLLSTHEAINRGVPVLGIPIFADQHPNMARAVSAGYGVILDFENITAESLISVLNEILKNPSYQESAQRLSRIYRDQPLSPLEQAVFWTEYVIRHKGAPHMRSAALDLTWYQYFLLDVIFVLAIIIVSFLILVFMIIKMTVRKVRGSKKSSTVMSEKKRK